MPKRIRLNRNHRANTGPAGTWVDVSRTSQWRPPWMPFGVRKWLRSVDVPPHETMRRTKQVCNYNYALWLQDGLPVTMQSMRGKLLAELPSLRGLDLACDCPLDSPCHADVLLALANGLTCDPITWLSAKGADACSMETDVSKNGGLPPRRTYDEWRGSAGIGNDVLTDPTVRMLILDTRTWNCIRRGFGDPTFSELCEATQAEWLRIPNMGMKGYKRLAAELARLGSASHREARSGLQDFWDDPAAFVNALIVEGTRSLAQRVAELEQAIPSPEAQRVIAEFMETRGRHRLNSLSPPRPDGVIIVTSEEDGP